MAQGSEHSGIRTRLEELLASDPLGERGAREVLLREGLDRVAVEAALTDTDWTAAARRAVAMEIDAAADYAVPLVIRSSLAARGFRREEIDAAVRDTDWTVPAQKFCEGALGRLEAPDRTIERLRLLGFAGPQFESVAAAHQKHNVETAKNVARLLLHNGISRRGLQHFLMEQGFAKADARAAIRELAPDWKIQAVIAAEEEALTSASQTEIEDALLDQLFTDAEIDTAMTEVQVGTFAAAERSAEEYLRVEAVSPEQLRDTLTQIGFIESDVDAVMAELEDRGIDWTEACTAAVSECARRWLGFPQSREALAEELRRRGYSRVQIERGLDNAGCDWVQRAIEDFRRWNAEQPPRMDSPRSVMRVLRDMGYAPNEAGEAARQLFQDRDEADAALSEVRSMFWACGPSMLEQFLQQAEYSPAIITDTMDNVYFDWNERALDALQQVYKEVSDRFGTPAPSWLRNVLRERGFEEEQIDYAFDRMEVDGDQQALSYAELVAEFGAEDAAAALQEAGFPEDVIARTLEVIQESKPQD